MQDSDRNQIVDASGGAVVATLPAAETAEPHLYGVKKVDATANTVTVQAAGSDTIDGAASYVLTVQYQAISLISDRASSWWIM